MVIIVEGPRNVGKSYLLSKPNLTVYKFPFAKYVKESYSKQNINEFDENNRNSNLHYFSIGTDLAILEQNKNETIYVDRNFLSTLVFGVLSNRITYEQAIIEANYILSNYNNFKIVYIYTENFQIDNRNKDAYTFYDYQSVDELYRKFFNELNLNVTFFNNTFDNQSIDNFKKILQNL